MTVRGKDADRFWFSLFHEIGHIILGHINQANGISEEGENAADDLAENILIPTDQFAAFTSKGSFDKISVQSFARRVGIDVGIVVGRLQKVIYSIQLVRRTKNQVRNYCISISCIFSICVF